MVKRFAVLLFFIAFLIFSIINISPKEGKNSPRLYSSTLQKRTVKENNQEKEDFLDELGNIIVADDKGYSTRIITKMDNSIKESYYDQDGHTVRCKSGYHAVIRSYDQDGYLIRAAYLNNDDSLVMLPQGYAIEEYRFDKLSRKEYVLYYDTLEDPVCTKTEGYGKRYEYDLKGRIYKITYLDQFGNAMMAENGYAIVIRSFYETDGFEKGKIKNEYYFDAQGKPIALSLGQYGLHREYNENGENIIITYLDNGGNPIITTKGYTTVLREYQGNSYIEKYFDINGQPFKFPEGQYGTKTTDGQVVYIDKNGNEQFNIRNFINKHPAFVILFALAVIILSSLNKKGMNIVILSIYLFVVIYFTLMYREKVPLTNAHTSFSAYRLFFVSDEARSSIIKNIWLFVPLGAILYKLCPQSKMLLIPLIISLGVELVQYFTGLGWCDIDDIISNSLGGAIGYEAGKAIKKVRDVLKNRGQEQKYSLYEPK